MITTAEVKTVAVKTLEITVLPDGRMDSANTARYSGYAEKTLAMKRMNSTGPRFIKQGRVWYYRADVDAWLAGGKK